jgi:hypothetical protein
MREDCWPSKIARFTKSRIPRQKIDYHFLEAWSVRIFLKPEERNVRPEGAKTMERMILFTDSGRECFAQLRRLVRVL